MNGRIVSLLASLLLAGTVSACSGGTEAQANNEAEAAVNDAAPPPLAENAAVTPAAAPATAVVGGPPTAEYMVGKWSAMDEDCSDVLEFRKDGTLTTPIGEAKWTLVGDKLTMDYGDGSKQPASTLKVLSQDRIDITTGGGNKEISKRC